MPAPDPLLALTPPSLSQQVHNKVPLVAVAADLWGVAFRAHFLPFWAHAQTQKLRCSRFDSAQHRAVHSLNAATQLAAALPAEKALAAQRAALDCVSAGIYTIQEAAQLLGIPGVKGSSSNAGTKNPADSLSALSLDGAESMARLLVFARAAWVSEELLTVDLGARTTGMQVVALHRRLHTGRSFEGVRFEDIDARAECAELPAHATHLHACVECRRLANAHVQDSGKTSQCFNELGTSSSMLCLDCDRAGEGHVRCAKRSSAALRTALQLEEEQTERRIEDLVPDAAGVRAALSASGRETAADASCAARARRDAKNALEQRVRATACGEAPMLAVWLPGRAVRLWGEWVALCSFCAAFVRVQPHNRFGGEICCLRCDAKMLGAPEQAAAEETGKICRFCGKIDPMRSGARWKTLKAPLDEAGPNRQLPPPLRVIHYCPTHWRSWMTTAHRTLPTRVVLSHLACGAKPVYGADVGFKKMYEADLGFDAEPKKKRRRLRTSKK